MPTINILKIIAVLVLGAIGALLFQVFIFPYLIVNPYFERFQFVKNLKEGKIIVSQKEQIIIQENTALEKAIEKAEKTVVGIQTKTKEGKILAGSGFFITSDGLLITLAELVPAGSDISIYIGGQPLHLSEKGEGQVLKRDLENNLALIKLEKTNLQTCGFADFEKIKLGRRVFLVGIIFKNKNPIKTVNEGIIKSFDENFINTNISEKSNLKGSPLFNIEGQLLGLNFINSEGKISAISVKKIKEFTGF